MDLIHKFNTVICNLSSVCFLGVQPLVYSLPHVHFPMLSSSLLTLLLWSNHFLARLLQVNLTPFYILAVSMLFCHSVFQTHLLSRLPPHLCHPLVTQSPIQWGSCPNSYHFQVFWSAVTSHWSLFCIDKWKSWTLWHLNIANASIHFLHYHTAAVALFHT